MIEAYCQQRRVDATEVLEVSEQSLRGRPLAKYLGETLGKPPQTAKHASAD